MKDNLKIGLLFLIVTVGVWALIALTSVVLEKVFNPSELESSILVRKKAL